jgi:hypothetical protein
MKKTKIEQRIKNAVEAFFETDRENIEQGLSLASDSALLKEEAATRFNEKGDRLIKILKRAFAFFPGVFYLFFGTFSILAFDLLWNPLTITAVFLIGSFLTIFGLGNLKNPKHLVIPLSIVAVALLAFSLFSFFGSLKSVFEYGIYLLPLALIAPFLVKSLVDKTDKVKID